MSETTPISVGGMPARIEKSPLLPVVRSVNTLSLLGFVSLHILIGLAFRLGSVFATVHALVTLAVGLFFLIRDNQPARMIYTAAYITGAEVLWRAAGAHVFWETGKYAIILLFLLAMLKYGRGTKISRWPIVYIVLLVPSIFIMPYFDRSAIAFALAGPFALAIAVMFFSSVRIDAGNLKIILISILAPTVALAVSVIANIAVAQNLSFSDTSNFVTSGDYGPNQVSLTLALGALVAVYLVFIEKKLIYRALFLGLSLWLLVQSALTFSRSGVWTSGAAVFVAGIYFIRNPRRRVGIILASILFGVLANYVIFPYLDRFTGNAISTRYADLSTTGRLEIAQADLMVFRQFPIFGVGPGQSNSYHSLTFHLSNAHTEYTRMLAEHGIFGLVALLLIVVVLFQRIASKNDPLSKGIILGMTVWALIYMASAATRLVAPSFLFGLAAARFVFQEKT